MHAQRDAAEALAEWLAEKNDEQAMELLDALLDSYHMLLVLTMDSWRSSLEKKRLAGL